MSKKQGRASRSVKAGEIDQYKREAESVGRIIPFRFRLQESSVSYSQCKYSVKTSTSVPE